MLNIPFVLIDQLTKRAFIARDTFGVRPLFQLTNENDTALGFASEMKMLCNLDKYNNQLIGTGKDFVGRKVEFISNRIN